MIINPTENEVVDKYVLNSGIATEVVDVYLKQKVYIEFYTVDDYVIQKNQVSKITKDHAHVLQKKAKVVSSLRDEALKSEIIKIMPIAKNEKDKERLTKIFVPFRD